METSRGSALCWLCFGLGVLWARDNQPLTTLGPMSSQTARRPTLLAEFAAEHQDTASRSGVQLTT
eukprot:NODE_5628_length_689_cov_4.339062_g4754_i0.p4 GENE.NODE_5628_length_689_cov_4.339062_g4754_i0~~NODE_5628_length_689_cov_4.339062_g4754_i0.p4  ORF type:complete len:65 (-),score=3.33 NODE_5628_length_689_cov_4.339062_g4754_i0:425-619(-)